MILFVILLLMLLMITVITVLTISVGGAAFIIVFGDVIVCAIFIVCLMKRLIRKRKK